MTTSRPHRCRLLSLCATLGVALGAGAPGLAQPCFPRTIVESVSLSQADKDKIKQCVEANRDGLSGDKDQIKKSRKALAADFDNPANVSVSFRLELSKLLLPGLTPLVNDKTDLVAANALQIAGEVATADSLGLLARGLTDPRPAVRCAAAYGYKRLFDQLRQSSPAFQPVDAIKACNEVAARIAAEKDPHVLEEYARALESGATVSTENVRGLRPATVAATAKEFGARIRSKDAQLDLAPAMIRAGQVLRDAVNKVGVKQDEPPLDNAVCKEAGGFGGDLLAFAKRRLAAGNVPANERDVLAGLADVGNAVYFFAAAAMGPEPPKSEPPGAAIRTGNDREFVVRADKIIGQVGALTRPPFELPPDRFTTPK